MAVVEALYEIAAVFLQELHLLALLHTFRDRLLAHLMRHLDDRTADVVGRVAGTDPVDEGFVDLDNVERHLLQVAE